MPCCLCALSSRIKPSSSFHKNKFPGDILCPAKLCHVFLSFLQKPNPAAQAWLPSWDVWARRSKNHGHTAIPYSYKPQTNQNPNPTVLLWGYISLSLNRKHWDTKNTKIHTTALLFSHVDSMFLAIFKSQDSKCDLELFGTSILACGPGRFVSLILQNKLFIFINYSTSSKLDKDQNASALLPCWAAP